MARDRRWASPDRDDPPRSGLTAQVVCADVSGNPSSGARPGVVARLRAAGCVFAEDEAELLISAATTPADLEAMVERRAAGEPIEHVLGWAEFCGLRIVVDPGVFRPRPRTEFLAGLALELTRPRDVVVDLCCGTGAVGAALVAARDGLELHAVDIDPAAVRCARRNLEPAGGRVYEGDLYQPLPDRLRGQVDVLVANAPYVPSDSIGFLPAEARLHEPRVALDGGADGLDILRRVIAEAPAWLTPGGHLLVETSERQAEETVTAVRQASLDPRLLRSDELDATAVVGTRRRGSEAGSPG
jgi:release factor glutamine methyltransferase